MSLNRKNSYAILYQNMFTWKQEEQDEGFFNLRR